MITSFGVYGGNSDDDVDDDKLRFFTRFGTYNFKNMKNTHEGVLLLVKWQANFI